MIKCKKQNSGGVFYDKPRRTEEFQTAFMGTAARYRSVYGSGAFDNRQIFRQLCRYSGRRYDSFDDKQLRQGEVRAAPEKEKIRQLLNLAMDMSGNANDVLQMCAFGYLKVSEFDKNM